ncbi:hypothetical protein [Bremerella sp.]|uniref:hypothetical protein n=1 Tax=Bremerella sp. TaxID=2795602 RepID=UPI00391A906C
MEEFVEAAPISYSEEFYPHGVRKVLALMVMGSILVLPEMFAWGSAPSPAEVSRSFPTGMYRPRGGFIREPSESTASKVLGTIGSILKRVFIIGAVTIALMVYYPRAGFKRFALLCGPIIALLVPLAIATYLQGRQEVYRVEVVLVTLVAALPGAALYVWLTWMKAKKRGWQW